MHFLLFYEKALGFEERQMPYQEAHRAYLQNLVDEGHLLLAGNLHHPTDGSALLLFQAGSASAVEAFAQGDPYVFHGIISRWSVRPWETVLGTILH